MNYGDEIYKTDLGGKAQKCYIGGKKKGDDDLPQIFKLENFLALLSAVNEVKTTL